MVVKGGRIFCSWVVLSSFVDALGNSLACWYAGSNCYKVYVAIPENLSRRPTTVLTQSSTYHAQTASLANDGDVQTDEQHCVHTANNHTKAWLQVDFGEVHSIHNVKIYHRREGMHCVPFICFILKHTQFNK
uniref:Uncharacterized protein n=1 Tax=Magallana gigas TaxID=29159 RepID=K1QWP7_MAGGI